MTNTEMHEKRARLTTMEDAMSYIQAGNATVTLVSTKSGARFTYKISESDDGHVFFVSLLTGPSNETDFQYIGIIKNGAFQRTAKSRVMADAPSFKAFAWTYSKLSNGKLPDELEVWHEGRCGRCGRKLTVPTSIANGIGPECAKKTGGKGGHADHGMELPL